MPGGRHGTEGSRRKGLGRGSSGNTGSEQVNQALAEFNKLAQTVKLLGDRVVTEAYAGWAQSPVLPRAILWLFPENSV